MPPPVAVSLPPADAILSRTQRAHSRLSWETRLARNARSTVTGHITIRLFGVPQAFADFLGLQSL